MDPPILRHQRKFNRATRESAGAHRERVMAALPADPGGRLCILGAGNCNDLDLPSLVDRFDEVHLVDLDDEALSFGLERQGVEAGDVRLHSGVDLCGIVERLDAWWEAAAVTDHEVEEAVRAVDTWPAPDLGGPFDVVASTCILTQLVDEVVNALGPDDPRTPRVAQAVRDRHLRLLVELAKPGGDALLVTDILSTSAYPELADVPESELGAFAAQSVRENRCFFGTNPVELANTFRTEPSLAPRVLRTTRSAPWKWDLGSLTFLVYALRIELR